MSNLAIIEVQRPPLGIWSKVGHCSNNPDAITRELNAILQNERDGAKARALDEDTRQLLDIMFK